MKFVFELLLNLSGHHYLNETKILNTYKDLSFISVLNGLSAILSYYFYLNTQFSSLILISICLIFPTVILFNLSKKDLVIKFILYPFEKQMVSQAIYELENKIEYFNLKDVKRQEVDKIDPNIKSDVFEILFCGYSILFWIILYLIFINIGITINILSIPSILDLIIIILLIIMILINYDQIKNDLNYYKRINKKDSKRKRGKKR